MSRVWRLIRAPVDEIGRRTEHAAERIDVVEDDPSRRCVERLIDVRVVPGAGDNPNERLARRAAHVYAVAAAVKVDPDLLGFPRVEAALKRGLGAYGARLLARSNDDVGEAVVGARDAHDLIVLGRVDVNLRGKEPIEPIGNVAQVISAHFESSRKGGAVHRVELRRDTSRRVVDDRICQPALECGGDRVPHRLFQTGEKSPVEETRVPGEPHEVWIRMVEAHELWIRIDESRERPDDAVEPNECPIPIARDRQPPVR